MTPNPPTQLLPGTMMEVFDKSLRALFRTELPYVEFHLTDHCNLNCKGCFHYCPIAPESYADVEQFKTDIGRLAQLFTNISKIRIMGGEPLLHPEVASFITASRAAFPRANIHLVTNGVLLPKAAPTFWDACINTNTDIHLSVYPPLQNRVTEHENLCKTHGVRLKAKDMGTFYAHDKLVGDSPKTEAFEACRGKFFCPFLQNGRLYSCFKPALIHYFNKPFNTSVAADRGVDIHAPYLTGTHILKKLREPIETCKWCSSDFVSYPWAAGHRVYQEWDVEAYRKQIGT